MALYDWENFVLYIKRAEINHDEEYIKNALDNIGSVKTVTFIAKSNDKGHKYNGAIIHFNYMKFGTDLYQIAQQFETTEEKTAKLYHNACRYWIVNQYIEHTQIQTPPPLPLINTEGDELIIEYNLLQHRCERQERKMMEYEEELTRKWFENVDLQIQLDKKNCYLEWKKQEIQEQKQKHEEERQKHEEERQKHEEEIVKLNKELDIKNMHVNVLVRDYETMKQELELVSNMLSYYEQKYGSYVNDA
jgi:hypothetical protein